MVLVMARQQDRDYVVHTASQLPTPRTNSDDSLHSLLRPIPILPRRIPVAFAVCERRLKCDVVDATRVHGVPTLGVTAEHHF